jgi:PTS system mannose-specific IIA component
MVKTLIVSHGELARVLLESAETIAGPNPALKAVSLAWDDGPVEARLKLEEAIGELGAEEGLLILTDMFGSTPNNVAAGFAEPGKVEVVAGVNLPMVLRLECMAETGSRSVGELAAWIETKGRGSIRYQAGELGKGGPCGD